jgi:hypothetical protein
MHISGGVEAVFREHPGQMPEQKTTPVCGRRKKSEEADTQWIKGQPISICLARHPLRSFVRYAMGQLEVAGQEVYVSSLEVSQRVGCAPAATGDRVLTDIRKPVDRKPKVPLHPRGASNLSPDFVNADQREPDGLFSGVYHEHPSTSIQ